MVLDEKSLKELLNKGSVAPILTAFKSLRRDLVATETVLRHHVDELAKLRDAFQELQDEKDSLTRGWTFLSKWFAAHDLKEEWAEVDEKYRIHRAKRPARR